MLKRYSLKEQFSGEPRALQLVGEVNVILLIGLSCRLPFTLTLPPAYSRATLTQ